MISVSRTQGFDPGCAGLLGPLPGIMVMAPGQGCSSQQFQVHGLRTNPLAQWGHVSVTVLQGAADLSERLSGALHPIPWCEAALRTSSMC